MEHSRGDAVAHILLVDDDPDQVEMYRYALEDAGFGVVTATTGGEAISARAISIRTSSCSTCGCPTCWAGTSAGI